MSLDITGILADWPYEPGQISARRIQGADGREKIQLRLDLGLLQMEAAGRPDGQRPHGHESLLDYYEHQLQTHASESGSAETFTLDERACETLRGEGMMYYHRYLAAFVLEDYDLVERDALRNLRLMDFCNRHAEDSSDKYLLEQYRPYVLMMCARARGQRALRDSRPKAGLAAVQKGIEEIETFYRRYDQEKMVASSAELAILRALAKELEARIPVDPLQKLNDDLDKAVREERYEDAVHLRDRIRQLTEPEPPAGGG
jgi:hypothetical protein